MSLSLRRFEETMTSTVRRFPWVILCAVLGTGTALWLLYGEKVICGNVRPAILMSCVLGLPLFFSLRISREHGGNRMRRPWEIIGVGLLAFYARSLPAEFSYWHGGVWIRFWILLAGLLCLALASPLVARVSAETVWHFQKKCIFRGFLALIYGGVLTVGCLLALVSLEKLFGIKFDKSYLAIFIVMTGLFIPLYFLGGVPRSLPAGEEEKYPAPLKAFAQFVLVPLVLIYAVILYVYGGKILFTFQWPQGWVAMPVLILSGTGILAALLLAPLRNAENERWARRYCRSFFLLLPPLVLLMLLALRVRIGEYGVTEARYAGVVIGGWLLVTCGILVRRPKTFVRWVPLSFAALCFLCAFGPWSMFNISWQSQYTRLEQALAQHGLLKDGKVVPARVTLSEKDYRHFNSLSRYLFKYHDRTLLKKQFADFFASHDSMNYNASHDFMRWLRMGSEYSTSFKIAITSDPLPIEGCRYVYEPFIFRYPISNQFGRLKLELKNGKLLATIDKAPPEPLPVSKLLQGKSNLGEYPPSQMFIDWPVQSPEYRIYFKEISFFSTTDKISNATVTVLEF